MFIQIWIRYCDIFSRKLLEFFFRKKENLFPVLSFKKMFLGSQNSFSAKHSRSKITMKCTYPPYFKFALDRWIYLTTISL